MHTYLLDADILAYILRRRDDRDRRVMQRLRRVLLENSRVILCPIAYYEALRGLVEREATSQLRFMDELSRALHWDDLRRADWESAASLWANCTHEHRSPGDADMVIAAHAKRHGAVLVTGNERHFRDLGIPVENWAKE